MATTPQSPNTERMNVVIIGHVDHGKSTVIGRLLADTGALPEGKLEQVKASCALNSKPFEYAFLLDALKDEQSQGITIDAARCFFKSEKRHYIVIDAPGHIEFLKNMVTGAARAEAAILVIDAAEGVKENSRRHGYLAGMLGIKQLVVLVNKMDLVGFSEVRFNQIKSEYTEFLDEVGIQPTAFVPVSAREGELLVNPSDKMPWYTDQPLLALMDGFEKEKEKTELPFRFPVQDIYKFTQSKDDRRIVAGTVATGQVSVGDDVVFLPSLKTSTIASIEGFNEATRQTATAGEATGFTLSTQIYIKPGELMVRAKDQPQPKVASTFKVNLFWLGKNPMVTNKTYKIKIGSSHASVYLKEIKQVLDASNLATDAASRQVARHDVAECVLQTLKPIALDTEAAQETTHRFVIVDDYEISGGGLATEVLGDETAVSDTVKQREFSWVKSAISTKRRAKRLNQKPKFIVITSEADIDRIELAKALEESLFEAGQSVYYLGISNLLSGLGSDVAGGMQNRDEHIRRLGEMAHLFTESGMILISTIGNLDDYDVDILRKLNEPNDIIVINLGPNLFGQFAPDAIIDVNTPHPDAVRDIKSLLYKKEILVDYYI